MKVVDVGVIVKLKSSTLTSRLTRLANVSGFIDGSFVA